MPSEHERNDQTGKVQGEGDYESARRFNQAERKFVKRHGSPQQPKLNADEEQKLKAAEERAGARGKEREHDEIDEEVFREKMTDEDKDEDGEE